MNPAKIVVHVKQGDGVNMVFYFLRERIRKPGESPHSHTHREVLPLDVTGGDVLRVGIAGLGFFLAAGADCRTVSLLFTGIGTVDLYQHRVVDIATEAVRNRRQVEFQSVCGELNAVFETAREILNKRRRTARVTLSDQPGANELGVGINRNPGPGATDTELILAFVGDVLILSAYETPDFVTLHSTARQIHQRLVEVFRAGRAKFNQQFRNRVLGCARHANGGTDRAAFNQCRYDLHPLVAA